MSETPTTTETPAGAVSEPKVDDVAKVREALEKERNLRKEAEKAAKANTDAAKRLAELEESQKTELQKAVERAEMAERALTERQAADEARRIADEVAKDKGILPGILRGSTREEIEAHAEQILAAFPNKQDEPKGVVLPYVPGEGKSPASSPKPAVTPGVGRLRAAYASTNK